MFCKDESFDSGAMKSCLKLSLRNSNALDGCYSCFTHYKRHLTPSLPRTVDKQQHKVEGLICQQTHVAALYTSCCERLLFDSFFRNETSGNQSWYCFQKSCGISWSQDFKTFCEIGRKISRILSVNGITNTNGLNKHKDAEKITTLVILLWT